MAGPLVYEMEIYDSSMRVQYNFVLVLPWILLLKGFHSAVNHEVTTTRLFGTAAFQTINFVKVSRSWRSSRVFKIWFSSYVAEDIGELFPWILSMDLWNSSRWLGC